MNVVILMKPFPPLLLQPFVLYLDSYHVGGFPPEVNEVMVKLFRHYMPNHAPIWTQVGVAALGLPTMRIEIRVTAITR